MEFSLMSYLRVQHIPKTHCPVIVHDIFSSHAMCCRHVFTSVVRQISVNKRLEADNDCVSQVGSCRELAAFSQAVWVP